MCHCAVETITPDILWKQLKIEGFLVQRWLKDWPGAFKEMAQWIQEVRLCLYCYHPNDCIELFVIFNRKVLF